MRITLDTITRSRPFSYGDKHGLRSYYAHFSDGSKSEVGPGTIGNEASDAKVRHYFRGTIAEKNRDAGQATNADWRTLHLQSFPSDANAAEREEERAARANPQTKRGMPRRKSARKNPKGLNVDIGDTVRMTPEGRKAVGLYAARQGNGTVKGERHDGGIIVDWGSGPVTVEAPGNLEKIRVRPIRGSEKVGLRTPKQAPMSAIASGKYDRVRHALDGVKSAAHVIRVGVLTGRGDPNGSSARVLQQHREIAGMYGAKANEIANAERLGVEAASAAKRNPRPKDIQRFHALSNQYVGEALAARDGRPFDSDAQREAVMERARRDMVAHTTRRRSRTNPSLQRDFNPVDYHFRWTKDWYEWDRPAAVKAARTARDAEAKRLKAAGYAVTKSSLPNQRITSGGIGTPHPEIDRVVTIYSLDARI